MNYYRKILTSVLALTFLSASFGASNSIYAMKYQENMDYLKSRSPHSYVFTPETNNMDDFNKNVPPCPVTTAQYNAFVANGNSHTIFYGPAQRQQFFPSPVIARQVAATTFQNVWKMEADLKKKYDSYNLPSLIADFEKKAYKIEHKPWYLFFLTTDFMYKKLIEKVEIVVHLEKTNESFENKLISLNKTALSKVDEYYETLRYNYLAK